MHSIPTFAAAIFSMGVGGCGSNGCVSASMSVNVVPCSVHCPLCGLVAQPPTPSYSLASMPILLWPRGKRV